MATATADNYSAASGATVYGGRAADLPAWVESAVINEWFAISGTVHAGSPADPTDDPLDAFCRSNRRLSYSNIALAGTKIVIAAGGGHNDGSGNEVTSIELNTDAPAWALNLARSTSVQVDVAYYADGKPSSRHLYHAAQYSTTRSRLMLHRSRFVYGAGISFNDSNGFNLASNTWDADGTWSDGNTPGCRDANDNVWALTGSGANLLKWTASTDTWSTSAFGSAGGGYPMAQDTARDQLFSLSWGDGEGGGTGAKAYKYNAAGTTRTEITFNASSAYTQWQADVPSYASMDYDPINDRFLFWDGVSRRLYAITPNSGTAWDMSIVTTTGATVPAMHYNFGRMKYVAALQGIVVMPSGHQALYFMRTA